MGLCVDKTAGKRGRESQTEIHEGKLERLPGLPVPL